MTLDDLIVSIGVDTSGMDTETAAGVERANSRLGDLGKGAAAVGAGAAVGKLFSDGLSAGVELAQVDTTLKNKFGLTEQEAKRAGDVAGSVYASGFGESISEVGDAIGEVQRAIGGMGDVSNEELQGMAQDAIALGQTYDQDVGDVSKAVGQILKTGLAKDGKEALDVLAVGFQNGTNKADDLLDTFNEYSTQFRSLGLDAKTATGLLSQGLQGGARDADLVADSLKEFNLRARDATSTAGAGFKSLGLDSKQMAEDVAKGGPKAAAALQKTLDALRKYPDGADKASIAANIFGTQSEDMQKALESLDPSKAVSGLGQVAGAADKAANSVSASQSLDIIWRTMATTIGETLQPALSWLGDFMTAHPAVVKIVATVLLALAVAFGIAAIAVWAMNSALLASPVTWVILAIVALIATGVLLYKNWDTVKAKLVAAWNAIKSAFGAGWNWMVSNVFSPIGRFFTSTIPGWVSSGVNYVRNKWNGLVSFFKGIPGAISRAVRGAFDGLKGAFRGAVNWIIGRWNGLSFSIGGGSFMGVSIPSVTIGTPNIPYLASGGVTTGPTLAMIGEGREDEAVLPLSRLDGMLNAARVQGVKGQGGDTRVVVDVTGTDEEMKRLIRKLFRVDGRGFGPATAR